MTLLHRKGYFSQRLDLDGNQYEEPQPWPVADFLERLAPRIRVRLRDKDMIVAAWRFWVHGCHGHRVPVVFLDTDLVENTTEDRALTDYLYGGNADYRLRQEAILGIGGVRMLRALGYDQIHRFHMNEGHSALLTLELLREHASRSKDGQIGEAEIEAVREQCVFTTHTPVPAGHDQFSLDHAVDVLDSSSPLPGLRDLFALDVFRHIVHSDDENMQPSSSLRNGLTLNLTYVALNLSRYVNGVAQRHGEISRLMFANYPVDAITNGVHAATWVSEPMAELFDRNIRDWRADNFSLRYALGIARDEFRAARSAARRQLFEFLGTHPGCSGLDPELFTVGFARRATAYKRPDLLFADPERLRQLVRRFGPMQVIYAGKAHPYDWEGKRLIRRIHAIARDLLSDGLRIIWLPDYGLTLARLLTSGVDLWLNTPLPPNEASGTSGMKAALNGVPSISTMDGWWIEGHIEGVTGWSIGSSPEENAAESLYRLLETEVLTCFYAAPDAWVEIQRNAVAYNGSFFNSQRMMQQYVTRAYRWADPPLHPAGKPVQSAIRPADQGV
ncbi:MAG: alpha-glucan family phosphorylase [Chromatiales bacterium]|nr:alpha-glucan family phosphorylase [Chromatiales bacterium]